MVEPAEPVKKVEKVEKQDEPEVDQATLEQRVVELRSKLMLTEKAIKQLQKKIDSEDNRVSLDEEKKLKAKITDLTVLKTRQQKLFIESQNQLKFKLNTQQELSKATHIGRIAEAFSGEAWLGALV
mmetsp:Transcript_6624/g.10650  ORF Transcript_6624/g.10650 Transcript_6624/m.10650 type:complete len:126 (-) Transcript_6624:572-949(-)|eukprot:CAMPEP_0170497920 /NCGR_PEP_ID=MMETSP0208-20121228/26255_1 /TAXON_ID=197538 /ORGANISM="Strombidium inclinatum, Strain S3" /LENGTH=125 /DNA_ID=CAMNT_0010774901 /DNA_START=70 /DNA_END=447 /DNA_ORIENTATION=+